MRSRGDRIARSFIFVSVLFASGCSSTAVPVDEFSDQLVAYQSCVVGAAVEAVEKGQELRAQVGCARQAAAISAALRAAGVDEAEAARMLTRFSRETVELSQAVLVAMLLDAKR
jgi:hypothetical protein